MGKTVSHALFVSRHVAPPQKANTKVETNNSIYEKVDADIRAEFEEQLAVAKSELGAGMATETTYKALRSAYSVLPSRMKVRVVDPSGTATGIAPASTGAPSSCEVYAIDGRSLGRFDSLTEARKHLPKGLYIVNGKKIIVR